MTTSSERSREFWLASAAHRRQVSVVADELLPGINSNLEHYLSGDIAIGGELPAASPVATES